MDPLEFLPVRISEWLAAFSTFDEAARSELATALVTEWIEGRLEPRLLADESGLRALRMELARVVDGLELLDIQFWDEKYSFDGRAHESVARRWCWIKPWILDSDHEDHRLMADRLVAPLLEEAAAGCPKRAYAIGIVEHDLRDQAHVALRGGWDAACAQIKSFERWLPHIRAVNDRPFLAYVERLLGYGAPQKITLRAAEARVKDLWRCYAPASVVLEQVGRGWRVRPDAGSAEWMAVDARTGAVSIDGTARERAERKGRWHTGRR